MTSVSRKAVATVFAVLSLQSQAAHSQEQRTTRTPTAYEVGERHATIHNAIRALEAAKSYMESAAHDFCGHRDAALAESNLTLNQLGLAVVCDKRRRQSAGPFIETSVVSWIRCSDAMTTDKHPPIRQAMNALHAARRDLNSAEHDYCGHRVEALEAVNRALTQLELVLECDKD